MTHEEHSTGVLLPPDAEIAHLKRRVAVLTEYNAGLERSRDGWKSVWKKSRNLLERFLAENADLRQQLEDALAFGQRLGKAVVPEWHHGMPRVSDCSYCTPETHSDGK